MGTELYDDEWSLADGEDYVAKALGSGYNRSRIYTKATDGHGHSVNTQVKSPENVVALLNKYVALGVIRSVQDGFRDAVLHRLHDYHEMHGSGETAKLTAEVLAMARIDTIRALHASRVEAIRKLSEGVPEIIASGDLLEAAAVVDEYAQMILDWPPTLKALGAATVDSMTARLKLAGWPT